MDFSIIFESLKNNYYSEILVSLMELFGIIIGLKHYRKSFIGQLFIFYLAFDLSILILFLFFLGTSSMDKGELRNFVSISNTLITFVELMVYLFYFRLIMEKRFHKYIIAGFISYCFLMMIFLFTKFNFLSDRLRYISDIIGVTEFLLLLPLCFFFYNRILKNESYFQISDRPSFWIVTGIFIFSTVSIPYYLISNFLHSFVFNVNSTSRKVLGNIFYYGPFLINIIFLIRGMLCKKELSI